MHLDRLISILEIVAVAGRGLTAAKVQKARAKLSFSEVLGLLQSDCFGHLRGVVA